MVPVVRRRPMLYFRFFLLGVLIFSAPAIHSAERYRVLKVEDDYTIVLIYSGVRERVRLIGIDRPPADDPAKPARYYRNDAQRFMKKMLRGRDVRVVPENYRRDMYGRLLAYIHLPADQVEEPLACMVGTEDLEIEFNASLIACGYSRVDTHFPFERMDRYARVEKERIEQARVAEEAAVRRTEEAKRRENLEKNFKYVAARKGQRFHRTDCRYAKDIPPEELVKFLTREEALEEAYLPCGLCDP